MFLLTVIDVPPDAALISNTNMSCLGRERPELPRSWVRRRPGFARGRVSGDLRGLGPGRGARGRADRGKYFVLSRVQLGSHSALLLLPSQEQKLGFSGDDFSRCAPHFSLSFFLLFSIVNFWNTTINIYKSCPEYFLLNHRGISGNSPITHYKLEA